MTKAVILLAVVGLVSSIWAASPYVGTSNLNFAQSKLPPSSGIANCLSQNPTYVIITRPMFTGSLSEFITFKRGEGHDVCVLTAEDINNTWNPGNPPLSSQPLLADKIKDTIQNYRSKGTQFFLLVGDAYTSIAYTGGTLPPTYHLEMNSLNPAWSIPTGYYYQDLPDDQNPTEAFTDVFFADPNDWDPARTGINHAVNTAASDGTDFAYVSRWPVKTADEVVTITKKTIAVAEVMTQFKQQILYLYNTLSSSSSYCNWGDSSFNQLGYMSYHACQTDIVPLTSKLGPSAIEDSFDPAGSQKQQFEQAFFGSLSFPPRYNAPRYKVMVTEFHGNHSLISAAGGTYYDSNAPRFKYPFPLMVMPGCSVGSFYMGQDDSLSEAFLKAHNGPSALAGPTFLFTFYSQLLAGKSIGEAYYASETINQGFIDNWKTNPTNWLGSGNGITLNGDDFLFGDPSIVLYPRQSLRKR